MSETKKETIEEFLKRGGKITQCKKGCAKGGMEIPTRRPHPLAQKTQRVLPIFYDDQ